MRTLIKNARIVNEEEIVDGAVAINGHFIEDIITEAPLNEDVFDTVIDAEGMFLVPGMIDDQVHFREPGLTHKAELATESKAAVAGGITSFMEMPNTVPNTLTQELLEQKYQRASEVSAANYSFFMGASNDNLEEVLKTDPKKVCGVKVFMGSSTGNMLVDKESTLEHLFKNCNMLIATHCEDEPTIIANTEKAKAAFGDDIPIEQHPIIRSAEACYLSSEKAIRLAEKHDARLHILHISTAIETDLFRNDIPLKEKRITAECCVHHLTFTDAQYKEKGTHIKWNPAVKSADDRDGVWEAFLDGRIDVLATDHAPHTLEEKDNSYLKAPSGGPLVQHCIPQMMEFVKEGKLSMEQLVRKMAHNVADMFDIEKRGYIRKGYYADVVLIDPESSWIVTKNNLLYKCGWSPFEGSTFHSKVAATWVNGNLVYDNMKLADLGTIQEGVRGMRLAFDR